LGIALAVLLDWVVPVRVLPEAHWLSLVNWVGVVVAVVGFAIEAGAARALASAGTSTRAGAGASVLVTAGPFEWSRNPFYLGLLLVLAGVVLAFSLDWGIVLVPLVWVALDRLVVPREEAMLRERFAGFEAYAGRVRRRVWACVLRSAQAAPPP
jgi:protein-S-isoprenylcysteine O-methyltransferase Ste14